MHLGISKDIFVIKSTVKPDLLLTAYEGQSIGGGLKWTRLSEQIFRLDKWNLCQG